MSNQTTQPQQPTSSAPNASQAPAVAIPPQGAPPQQPGYYPAPPGSPGTQYSQVQQPPSQYPAYPQFSIGQQQMYQQPPLYGAQAPPSPQQQGPYPPQAPPGSQPQSGYPPQAPPPPPGSQPGYPPQPYPQQGFAPPPQGYPYMYPPGQYPPPQLSQYPPPQQQPGQWPQQPVPVGYPPQQQQPQVPALTSVVPANTSVGYTLEEAPDYDPTRDATVIKKALERQLDLSVLTRILPRLTPAKLNSLRKQLYQREPSEIMRRTVFPQGTTGEILKEGFTYLLMGPCNMDAYLINKCLKGGKATKQAWMLQIALLQRTPGDLAAIERAYQQQYGWRLRQDIREAFKVDKGDLPGNLFLAVLESPQKPGSAEVPSEQRAAVEADIKRDVIALDTALTGKAEGLQFAQIFATASKARLGEIVKGVEASRGKGLKGEVKKVFKDPFEDMLEYMLDGVGEPEARDAALLEKTMKGFGTKDEELLGRLVKVAWDKQYLKKVKQQYARQFHGKGGLTQRIRNDTSGEQEQFLVAVATSDE